MIGPQRSLLTQLIGSLVGVFIVFSQRLTSRLLFFVVRGGVELSQTALQTQTIDRSVLSSLWIMFARPITLQEL